MTGQTYFIWNMARIDRDAWKKGERRMDTATQYYSTKPASPSGVFTKTDPAAAAASEMRIIMAAFQRLTKDIDEAMADKYPLLKTCEDLQDQLARSQAALTSSQQVADAAKKMAEDTQRENDLLRVRGTTYDLGRLRRDLDNRTARLRTVEEELEDTRRQLDRATDMGLRAENENSRLRAEYLVTFWSPQGG